MTIRRLIILLAALYSLHFDICSKSYFEQGDKLISFFNPQVYKGGIQVWDVKTGENGCMFFATQEGLSVFDGVRWIYPNTKGNNPPELRTLFYDKESKIVYGAGDNFTGFWQIDNFGQFVYTPIFFNNEPDRPKMFWRIGKVGHYIYFGAKEIIIRYNILTKELDEINSVGGFHFMYIVDNTVYMQEKQTLYQIKGTKKEAIPLVFDDRIVSIIKDKTCDSLIIFRENKGIYYLSKDFKLSEVNSLTNRIIGNSKIFNASEGPNNTYLLGTILGGLYQIDSKGNIIRKINKENGLPYVSVLNSAFDSDVNIWMGLEGGIAKINNAPYESYLVDYDEKIGGVYSLHDHNGNIYTATNKGVFVRNEENKYQFIENTQGQVWNIVNIDNDLYACHDIGIFKLNGNSAQLIYDEDGAWNISPIPHRKNVFLCQRYHGFSIFEYENGRISKKGDVGTFKGDARDAAFDKYNYLWTMAVGVGYYRFSFNEDLLNPEIKLFKLPNNESPVFMFNLDNDVIFCSGTNAYKYDSMKDQIVEDEYAKSLIKQCGEDLIYMQQYNNLIWFITKNEVGYIVRNHNQFRVFNQIFDGAYDKRIPRVFQKIRLMNDGSFAYGLQNRIGIYEYHFQKEAESDYPPKVSAIEVLDGGISTYVNLENKKVEVSSKYEHIHIYINNLYKNKLIEYRISGQNEGWILTKVDNFIQIPHLSEGNYKIEIRNYGQQDGELLTLKVTVSPPWYLSKMAATCYILGVILLILFVHFYNKRKTKLLLLVEQKKLIEQEEAYKREKLESDIKEKDKKLASFMLQELNKKNTLSEIRDTLISFLEDKQQTNLIKSCINTIDKNMNTQEEWRLFLKYFNNIYDGYFDRLNSKYENLTLSDLKLCAYLKLRLNTKEIATMFNISPASVDTARHRLRKKLNLANGESLSKFLSEI